MVWLQLGAKHGECHVRQFLFGLQPDTWNGQKCAGLLVAVTGCLCGMVFLEEYLRKEVEKARLKVSCGQSEDQPKRSAASTVAARSHTEPQGGEQGCG